MTFRTVPAAELQEGDRLEPAGRSVVLLTHRLSTGEVSVRVSHAGQKVTSIRTYRPSDPVAVWVL